MCVYGYRCVYGYTYVCVYGYTYVCVCMGIHMCVCVYVLLDSYIEVGTLRIVYYACKKDLREFSQFSAVFRGFSLPLLTRTPVN